MFANLLTRLGAFLKESHSPFYNEFCVFEEEEGDDTGKEEAKAELTDGSINNQKKKKKI